MDIFIIRQQIRFRALINKSFFLRRLVNRLNSYMGYRADVVEYLLTSAPAEQQAYFGIRKDKNPANST